MAEPFHSAEKAKPEASAARTDGARALVLGLNAWLVLAVLPMLFAEPRTTASFAWLALPIAPLVLGVGVLERSQRVGGWILLGGFPTLLAAIVAVMPRLVVQDAYSTVGLVLGALSLVGYGAGAAFAAMRPTELRPTSRRPLGSVSPMREPITRTWARRLLLGAGGLAGLVLAVVAPSLGGMRAYEQVWGRAAPEASVLTAVVGGALGTATLAMFVGPALRAPRTRPPSRRTADRRVVALLFSVAVSVAFYVFYVTRG